MCICGAESLSKGWVDMRRRLCLLSLVLPFAHAIDPRRAVIAIPITPAGCTGNDEYSKTMEKIMNDLGSECRYMKDEATPTGTCAVCIVDAERSLVANLAAANNYKLEHTKSNWDLVEKADIIYRYFPPSFLLATFCIACACISRRVAEIAVHRPYRSFLTPLVAALAAPAFSSRLALMP